MIVIKSFALNASRLKIRIFISTQSSLKHPK